MTEPIYKLTIDLNTLNHLGIGLYSNIPAVISEVVANSYDADAAGVIINIDANEQIITIQDDGWGMTQVEINKKFLTIGYDKRKSDPGPTPKGRYPMGRKGIGKLSLFSIADIIEVHSVKTDSSGNAIEKNGFIMDGQEIKRTIETGGPYNPKPVELSNITIQKGTKITLSKLKSNISTTEGFLRRRLARRFSIIGSEYGFSVIVNKQPIDIKDRDFFPKIEYVWYIGNESKKYADQCLNKLHEEMVDGIINTKLDYKITGWVGTFDEQRSIEEGNNTIVILARGKLIHEDILKDIKEGGVFTKYLIGEIQADFLDIDAKQDIATSDRQSLKEDDERFIMLKRFIQDNILKRIQQVWRDWRKEDAEKKALENPKINEWFEQLSPDHKKYARILFSKIESFPIENKDYKKELYRHGIIAFETLALKQNLSALDFIKGDSDLSIIKSIFMDMDALEETHYYQIIKGRIAVLSKFEQMVNNNAKEKIIQQHIYDHLWLLDPSWERASTNARVEETVMKEFEKINAGLDRDEKEGRIDIRYRTAGGKHIIIELKRYTRKVKATELASQIEKYRRALKKCLEIAFNDQPAYIECICLVGSRPEPQDEPDIVEKTLSAQMARYMTYDELIKQTQESYQQFLDANKKINKLRELIDSI